ncbi:MAG: DUF1622 domain-containing protein [Cetobacterium sp.]
MAYDFFNTFLHWLAFIFFIIFIFIICLGTFKSINMLLFNRDKISFKEVIKEIFEKYLILALKFLIITTIINVLIKINIQNIIFVILIVGIREILKWEHRQQNNK